MKKIVSTLLLFCSVILCATEHCIATYQKGDDGFEFYFLKDTIRNTTGIMLMSGDTLFPPIYGNVCYYWRGKIMSYFLVHDSLCYAGVYTRSGECIIPESRGYDEILDVWTRKCFAWNCYKLNDTDIHYIKEVCDWKGNVVFKPIERYVECLPIYQDHRMYFMVRSIRNTLNTHYVDINGKRCYDLDELPKEQNLLPYGRGMFKRMKGRK